MRPGRIVTSSCIRPHASQLSACQAELMKQSRAPARRAQEPSCAGCMACYKKGAACTIWAAVRTVRAAPLGDALPAAALLPAACWPAQGLIQSGFQHGALHAGLQGARRTWPSWTTGCTRRGNASACIAAGTCMPLGGHSVVAALPPVRAGGDAKPVTLVLAGVDSTAFFHDRAKARAAPLSDCAASSEALTTAGLVATCVRRKLKQLARRQF